MSQSDIAARRQAERHIAIEKSIQAWVSEHKDVSFKRPKGKVVYTVTGRTDKGWGHVSAPIVQRSSDGSERVMSIKQLKAMEIQR